jgi:uncharacterized membrane protein
MLILIITPIFGKPLIHVRAAFIWVIIHIIQVIQIIQLMQTILQPFRIYQLNMIQILNYFYSQNKIQEHFIIQ